MTTQSQYLRFALAGALALSAAATQAATLADGTTGNGSLILNAYDATSKVSYAFDTGLRLNDFTGTGNLSFDLSSDPNWQAFQSQITSGDYVRYNVVSWADVNSPTNFVALSTSNANVTEADNSIISGDIGFTTNNQLKQATAGENPFINALNAPFNDPSNPNAAHNSAYIQQATYSPGYFGESFQDTWNTKFTFDTTADIGTALNFYRLDLTAPFTNNLKKVTVTTFSGQWDLTSAGELSYTAVPEASTAASLMGGIGALAVLGWARRGKNAA